MDKVEPRAAVLVRDHYPTDDEIDELTHMYLDDYPADYAKATSEVIRKAPDFMATCEQDQINAHLRDGGPRFHVLVVYMQEIEPFDDDDDEDYDEED